MENQIQWIIKTINDNADKQHRNEQKLTYPENFDQTLLESLKTQLKANGWKVNKRGPNLLLSREQ